MIQVPDGSIYYWMYVEGLKHTPIVAIEEAVWRAGKEIRKKDYENYWRGWQNSDLRQTGDRDIFKIKEAAPSSKFFERKLEDYPIHPYLGYPEIIQKWVPCNADNKPMVKWGDELMTKIDATCKQGCVYLGENMRGSQTIVIDCDGDHETTLDLVTIAFLNELGKSTHVISKPKKIKEYEGYQFVEEFGEDFDCAASFHLTYKVDRIIPTMHFPEAHIDIIGNEKNSLRYWKNKQWNGIEPAPLTSEIWEQLKRFIRRRKYGYESVRPLGE